MPHRDGCWPGLASQPAPSGGPREAWQPTRPGGLGLSSMVACPLPCNRPVGGATRHCHLGKHKAGPTTSDDAGWTCLSFFFFIFTIFTDLFSYRVGASNHVGSSPNFSHLARCHTGAGGPTAPQAPATDRLGLATPVWPGYEIYIYTHTLKGCTPMSGKNRRLVTNEPVEFEN
jgi:hypothetical protein